MLRLNNKTGTSIIDGSNQPVRLDTLHRTRGILLQITMIAGATADAVITFTDYFANILLAIKTFALQVGGQTPVNISGQMLAYVCYYMNRNNQYTELTTSGTIAAKNTQYSEIYLDMSLLAALNPTDATIDPSKASTVIFVPYAAVGDIFSNAGGAIQSTTVDVIQVYDALPGTDNGVQGMQKWITSFSDSLTASSNGQNKVISIESEHVVEAVIMLVGSSGTQGKITTADGLNNMTISFGGTKPYDTIPARSVKGLNLATRRSISDQFTTYASASASGSFKGLTGCYIIDSVHPDDAGRYGQMWPNSQNGTNKLIVDTNANGSVFEAAVIHYKGTPPGVVKK